MLGVLLVGKSLRLAIIAGLREPVLISFLAFKRLILACVRI